jgi:hypothetical protein
MIYILHNGQNLLSLALSAYNIWNSNVIRKCANLNSSSYNDTVLFTTSEKDLILNLCDIADDYSTDIRYQAIIDTVRATANRFAGHTISYVRTNFH